MLAVDTNVVVRYLVNDDPAQARIARKLIDDHASHVPDTVLLETEWVLRGVYQFERTVIHAALTAFIGLHGVSVDYPARIAQALDWFKQGMDFADALHLASCGDGETFATFDRKLAATARKAEAGKVRTL